MFLRDRHQLAAEEVELAAEEGELTAYLADGLPVIAAEVGNGLMVGGEALEEPHEFQVTARFSFKQATGADAVEVAIDVELEQVGGVVGWAAGLLEHGVAEAQASQIEGVDEGVQETHKVILGDVIIEDVGEEGNLAALLALDVLHARPPGRQTRRADLP